MLHRRSQFLRQEEFSNDAEELFMRIAGRTPYARKVHYDNLICTLRGNGVWNKLDVLYSWAAHTEQAGNLNIKRPGKFTSAPVNSPTWTLDRGYTGNGAGNSVLTTGYTPTAALLNWVQDSAHIGVYSLTDVAEAAAVIGSSSGTAPTGFLVPRSATDQASIRLNDNTNLALASTSSIGHFVGVRHGASSREIYHNGVSLGTDATASTGMFVGELRFLRHPAASTTRQLAIGHAGGDLTTTEALAFYTALNTFLAAIGAV